MSTQKENLLQKKRHSLDPRCEKSVIIDPVQPRPASIRLTSNVNENAHVIYPMYTSLTPVYRQGKIYNIQAALSDISVRL
ncbi:hypothetical protein CHS0354_004153 [Potamilus streckersoni]|uniref:Uncharacterized protein n=1 Tax=Potamilus streckersoni TaxID=2493646 RepID=A0AAE0SZC5_9BIVA|nr:hypothetical protein CHS0354_004153 [Potamilus streckersoni]